MQQQEGSETRFVSHLFPFKHMKLYFEVPLKICASCSVSTDLGLKAVTFSVVPEVYTIRYSYCAVQVHIYLWYIFEFPYKQRVKATAIVYVLQCYLLIAFSSSSDQFVNFGTRNLQHKILSLDIPVYSKRKIHLLYFLFTYTFLTLLSMRAFFFGG
jgi:hypothetical protein